MALEVSKEGGDVLYIDNESEAPMTMVSLIEGGDYEKEHVDNIEYVQVDESERGETNYDTMMQLLSKESQSNYDLIVVDPLDHKHTYALKKVVDSELASDADWNQYPAIYSREKQVMELISKPHANIVATLDPKSGKSGKPKGAQTNIKGYFNIVLDLTRDGDEWGNIIRNFVGRGEVIGKQDSSYEQNLSKKLINRIEDAENNG